MQAVIAKLLPVVRNFARQIVPPVVATLIAALLIAGFNRAFTGHLVQPRMAALHNGAGEATRAIVYATDPQEAAAMIDGVSTFEPTVPERIFAKDDARAAGKDQAPVRLASAPAATPAPAAAPRAVTRKSDAAPEVRPSEPRIAAVPPAVSAPVTSAPSSPRLRPRQPRSRFRPRPSRRHPRRRSSLLRSSCSRSRRRCNRRCSRP